MKASTPIEMMRPPLTLALTRPVATEPSGNLVRMLSQFFFCSALSNERMGLPLRSSSFSTSTSIVEPICRSPMSMNSFAGMTPSDLPPMSTTTSFWRTSVMVPGTIAPSLSLSKEDWASSSCITELICGNGRSARLLRDAPATTAGLSATG